MTPSDDPDQKPFRKDMPLLQNKSESKTQMPQALSRDYDTDPDRFRSGQEAVKKYGLLGDVHEPVAKRLIAENRTPILDLGCGEGRLSKAMPNNHPIISIDLSTTMLQKAPQPKAQANGMKLPFKNQTFGSVAALWCLYHFDDPVAVIREAKRVLSGGGLFVASTSARTNDPELAHLLPNKPSSFDAEDAADIVAQIFDHIEVERWDQPAVHLPDNQAIQIYLRGRGFNDQQAREAAQTLDAPLTLTKRGCLIYAYRSYKGIRK